MRKIHINNSLFKYKVGKQHVKILLPDGKSVAPSYADVTGRLWMDIERDSYDRSFSIKPSDIRNYILKKIIPYCSF